MQQKFIVPLNRDTEHIYDNKDFGAGNTYTENQFRMIIDAPVLTEPRAWVVTKVNRLAANGLINVTLAQDRFDQNKDEIELDKNGNVIGMWANAKDSAIAPTDYEEAKPIRNTVAKITYPGKPELKLGGNFKTFTVKFYQDDSEVDYEDGNWSIKIDGVEILNNSSICSMSKQNSQLKCKLIDDKNNRDTYTGKIAVVSFTSNSGIADSIEVEVKPL